jgi:hypothetical protein
MKGTLIGNTMLLLVIAGLVSIPIILTSKGEPILLGVTLGVVGTIVVMELIFIGVKIVEMRKEVVI